MIFGGYARNGDYHELLSNVARITRNGVLPFILAYDFNKSPKDLHAELETNGMLEYMAAEIIAVGGISSPSTTCHVGTGSAIDYLIVSGVLAP